jgi:hypothetical protein
MACSYGLYGKPYRVNYAPSTPLPRLREGIRSYFAQNVVRPAHIGVDVAPIRCPIQPTLHPLATEEGRWDSGIIDRQRIRVEEACLTGVALLGDANLDAHQLRLLGEQLNEAGMRHTHEVLIIPPAPVRVLLLQGVLADTEGADALIHQQRDEAAGCCVQVLVNPPCALRGEALQSLARVLVSQVALEPGSTLVVILVDGLDWPPVDETRDKARFV